jgi:phage terminase small subunit
MTLTIKQENFCLEYIKTGNASEAYRQSYNAEKMQEATVSRKAKELMDNGKITAKLEELRKPVIQAAQITLESHLTELANLRDAARGAGQMSAAVTAEVARGKAAGFYVERKEVTFKPAQLNDSELMREMATLAKELNLPAMLDNFIEGEVVHD